MSERRPYTRPMKPDWWAHPPYRAYSLREFSGVAVTIYGAVLLIGLICLAGGRTSFGAYLWVLGTPVSVLFHLLLLAAVLFHMVTWFQILPKTMPKMIRNGKQVSQGKISKLVLLGVVYVSMSLLLLTIGLAQ